MGKPMTSMAWPLACLASVVFVATLATNESTMKNLVLTTRQSISSWHQFEVLHHGAPTLDRLEPVFHSYRIFDVPENEITKLGVLDWPEVCGSFCADRNNVTWTESVPAGLVTRYISKGTVQLTMRNEISSSGRFMGAGSLVDIEGPVKLLWAPKYDDEQVVIRAPTKNGPHKLLVVTGAFTLLCGVVLARELSSVS